MAIAAKCGLVADPVFESVMRHGGTKPIEISVMFPDKYRAFLKESDVLRPFPKA